MTTRRTAFSLAYALLLSACATFDSPRQALVTVRIGFEGQERSLRFQSVHAGQVVVEGIWTVIFKVDERDVSWIRDVAKQEGAARLVWDGRVVWEFHPATDGLGYFIDLESNDEATARRVAGEILSAQGPRAHPAAELDDAAGDAAHRN